MKGNGIRRINNASYSEMEFSIHPDYWKDEMKRIKVLCVE